MRIFVFESLSAGPFDDASAALAQEESLLREGWAMLGALADDLAAVDGTEVCTIVGGRHSQSFSGRAWRAVRVMDPSSWAERFDQLAAISDATVVIAPEIGGELARLCRRVADVGGRLLGSNIETVELLSDKQRTAEFLRVRGVPVCRGTMLVAGLLDWGQVADMPLPAVIKPLDGAGSLGVRLVRSAAEIEECVRPRRLEQFVPGIAASVAVLCGPNARSVLPPCAQRLADDGQFAYLGGSAPLPPALAARAKSLAERAVDAVPGTLGYVGVDLVLGNDPDGRGDVVIEINPRLTTSYVGLRRLAESNLAAAMLHMAAGRSVGALRFRPGRVEFDCCGTVNYCEDAASADAMSRPRLTTPVGE